MHVAQPVIAAAQHVGKQIFNALDVIVEVREQPLHVLRDRIVALHVSHRGARGLQVQFVGVLHALGLRAEARQHGHLARERGAQRVYGLYAQPRRVVGDVPARRRIARQHRRRELQGELLVRALRRNAGARRIHCLQHALAHLAGGLARERDGDDLLRMLHAREQAQIALDQQLGLARARRRLHDEGLRRVERAAALPEIRNGGGITHGCPSLPLPSSSGDRAVSRRSWMRHRGLTSQ
jgi:hypothetical protein